MFEDILRKTKREKDREIKEKWPWYDPTMYFFLVRESCRVNSRGIPCVNLKLLSKVIGSDKDIDEVENRPDFERWIGSPRDVIGKEKK